MHTPTSHTRVMLDNSTFDNEFLSSIAYHADQSKEIAYACSVVITPEHLEIASKAGAERTRIARSKNYSDIYRRGAEDERVDRDGCLGEVIIYDRLARLDGVHCAPLVEEILTHQVDVTVYDREVDVKTISTVQRYANINEVSHKRNVDASAYLLVKIVDDAVADIFVVDYKSVEAWKYVSHVKDPFYSGTLPTIR